MLAFLLTATAAAAQGPENSGDEGSVVAVGDASNDAVVNDVEEQEKPQSVQPTFNIWQYEVRGASALPVIEIQKALYPFLGPNRSLSTIEEAANALIALFDSKGYAAAVDIPPQDVVNGVVILKVTEGVVSRVTVSNAKYFLPSKILESVPSAKKGEVLRAETLQEEIVKLNKRSADLKVTPALSPGRRPGELEVDLRVYDELPVSGSLTLNDHYSAYTTRLRLSGSIAFNNLWQRMHSVSLWGLTNPEDTSESKVYSLTYSLPVGERNHLSLNYINSESATDTLIPNAAQSGAAAAGPANGPAVAAGDATIASLSYLMRPSFSENTSFSLALNYKDVEEFITPLEQFLETGEIPARETTQTPIEYFTFSGGVNHGYSGDIHSGNLGLSFNTSIRELNNADEFADKRDNARLNFFIINGYLNHRVKLPLDFALLVEFSGQYSELPLISNEQWRVGGSNSVRGYLESQELGDYGFDSTLQLESPSVLQNSDHSLLFHVFYDYGYAGTKPTDRTVYLNPDTNEANPGSNTSSASLASYGLGFQYQYRRTLNASLDWASVLKDSCDTLSTLEINEGIRYCSKEGDVASGDTRVTFNISTQF